MPKKKKTLKESKNSKLLNSYLNFIDSNFSSNTFTYRNVVDWLNDSEDTAGKNVNFIVAMLVKSWILSEYIVDNGDGTFTPIYFEDDEEEYSFKDVDIEDDERFGKPEFDDEYIRDYGNRDMRFPKINDSFDESKKVVKESVEDEDIKQKFCEVIAKEFYDKDLKTFNKFKKSYLEDDSDLYKAIVSKLHPYADRIVDIVINYIKDEDDKFKNESKKPAKNERRTIIEKYVKARKHK